MKFVSIKFLNIFMPSLAVKYERKCAKIFLGNSMTIFSNSYLMKASVNNSINDGKLIPTIK